MENVTKKKNLKLSISNYTGVIFIPLILCFIASCNKKQKVSIKKPSDKVDQGVIKNLITGCNYSNTLDDDKIKIHLPKSKEITELKNIVSFSGIPLNFKIFEADIKNAVATIINDERYILYDPNLLNFANKKTKSYWSSVSILAHEIGHHLSGHTLKQLKKNTYKAELEADKFSGFILYKMGASLKQATKTMKVLGSIENTKSHPNKKRRIKSIIEGWKDAYKKDYKSATPPPLKENPNNFYEYTMEMLYNEKFYKYYNQEFFTKYDFFYGVVTKKEIDYKDLKNVTIEVIKTGSHWKESAGSLNGRRIKIWIDMGDKMCNACWRTLPGLLMPGRRVKFAFNEGHPSGGTAYNGVFHLSYIKAISSNKLDFYLRKSNNLGKRKIINNFLIAEEKRNFNQIYKYFSENLKRYWKVKNPTYLELKNQYEKAWKNTDNSKNLVDKIEKLNKNKYILHTIFQFYDLKKKKWRNFESKVVFKFNDEGKIVEIYGAN